MTAQADRSPEGVATGREGYAGSGLHVPFEGAARRLNRDAHLYLSEGQQKQLAGALFAGVVLLAAGLAFSLARASRRYLE